MGALAVEGESWPRPIYGALTHELEVVTITHLVSKDCFNTTPHHSPPPNFIVYHFQRKPRLDMFFPIHITEPE